MTEQKSIDRLSEVERLILRVALILFLLIGVIKVLKVEWASLWHEPTPVQTMGQR